MTSSTRNLLEDLALAQQMADAADAITLARYQSLDLVIETKPDATPVTDADKATERKIRELISENRSDDLVIGEEYGAPSDTSGKYYWVIDPIDGTKNFVRGIPVWATLIGLVSPEHEVVVGVVSAPALARRWSAAAGHGAYVVANGAPKKKIHVSAISQLEDSQLLYSDLVGWGNRKEPMLALQQKVWRTRGIGDFWSHLLVAEGAADIAVEPILALWDMAALDVIVREAGGRFTNLDGVDGPHGGSGVSSNSTLHSSFLDALNGKK
ncbi:MAG: inositol monophosphatase family protein [Actinomycetes bacterium]